MWGTEDKYVSAVNSTPSKDNSGHSDYLKVRFPRENNIPAVLDNVREGSFPHLRSNADLIRAAVNLLLVWSIDNEAIIEEQVKDKVEAHLAREKAEALRQELRQNKEDVERAKQDLHDAYNENSSKLPQLIHHYETIASNMDGKQRDELLKTIERYK